MFGPIKEISKGILNLSGGLIAFSLVGLLCFLAWALIFVPIPADNREPVVLLLGIVSTNVGTIIAFFYGTSYGSQKKSEAITELSKVKP